MISFKKLNQVNVFKLFIILVLFVPVNGILGVAGKSPSLLLVEPAVSTNDHYTIRVVRTKCTRGRQNLKWP